MDTKSWRGAFEIKMKKKKKKKKAGSFFIIQAGVASLVWQEPGVKGMPGHQTDHCLFAADSQHVAPMGSVWGAEPVSR